MFRLQSINHSWVKIKHTLSFIDKKEVYMVVGAVLLAANAYGIGLVRGIVQGRPPVTLERFTPKAPTPAAATTTNSPSIAQKQPKTYVASKTGTKYHLPTCIGARSISEQNKIWFSTKAEAEKAGYAPAGNCKGI